MREESALCKPDRDERIQLKRYKVKLPVNVLFSFEVNSPVNYTEIKDEKEETIKIIITLLPA